MATETLSPPPPVSKSRSAVTVRKSVTINRTPQDLYGEWHDFSSLPRFMEHLIEVDVLDAKRSHWVAQGPADTKIEWDAEITEDVPGCSISWRSLPGADVPNEGIVRFVPGPVGRGTRVSVELRYQPPAGKLGQITAKLFGEEPTQQVEADLRRFKALMETGEIPTTKGQPHGD